MQEIFMYRARFALKGLFQPPLISSFRCGGCSSSASVWVLGCLHPLQALQRLNAGNGCA